MKRHYKILTIPLIALAFLPVVYQFVLTAAPKTNTELFDEHFTPQRLLDDSQWRSERSTQPRPAEGSVVSEEGKKIYRQAVQAYQSGAYQKAVEQFEAYQAHATDKERSFYLYLGISYLATEQLDQAETTFKQALQQVSIAKKGDAEWYLVLTLIRKNALDQAEQYLKALIARAPEHPRREQAVQLQQQIQQHQPS